MDEHFFDGTPEGLRGARRLLAISWMKYFIQLIAFFIAPIIVLLCKNKWMGLAGLMAIMSVCVLDILPQMIHVAWDKRRKLAEFERAFDLLCLSAPLFGAALLLFQKDDLRIVGAFIWIIGHLIDLAGPPRMEKTST